MKNALRFFVFAVFLIASTGCYSTFYTSQLGSPDLQGASPKDSLYVESNSIYIGMPIRFAVMVLGDPEEIDAYEGRQRWRYNFRRTCRYTERCDIRYQRATLWVQNDKVKEVDNFPGYYLVP